MVSSTWSMSASTRVTALPFLLVSLRPDALPPKVSLPILVPVLALSSMRSLVLFAMQMLLHASSFLLESCLQCPQP